MNIMISIGLRQLDIDKKCVLYVASFRAQLKMKYYFLLQLVLADLNTHKIQHESKELAKVTSLLDSLENDGEEFVASIFLLYQLCLHLQKEYLIYYKLVSRKIESKFYF